jgi:exopolysaccharide production protein ExoZ
LYRLLRRPIKGGRAPVVGKTLRSTEDVEPSRKSFAWDQIRGIICNIPLPNVLSTTGLRPPLEDPRMATSNREPKLLGIEAGRGIAASLVVLYHASRHLDSNGGFEMGRQIFQFGHAGVDFFFVISGFIILFVHWGDVGRSARLERYASRRFTRIFPTYWAILCVILVFRLVSDHRTVPPAIDIASAVTLFPTWAEPVVGVSWSLQHEIIFYLIFAVLIIRRRAGLVLLGCWLIAIAAVSATGWSIAPRMFAVYNMEFFLGMAAAFWLRRSKVPCAPLVLLAGASAFAAAAVAEDLSLLDGYGTWARFAYGIPSAWIVLGLAQIDRERPFSLPKPLLWVGSASYSIYLFHIIGIGIFYKLWSAVGLLHLAPVWLTYAAIVAAGIIGGILFSRAVEYPLMGLLRARRRVEAKPVLADG